jgi:hypothetical protein
MTLPDGQYAQGESRISIPSTALYLNTCRERALIKPLMDLPVSKFLCSARYTIYTPTAHFPIFLITVSFYIYIRGSFLRFWGLCLSAFVAFVQVNGVLDENGRQPTVVLKHAEGSYIRRFFWGVLVSTKPNNFALYCCQTFLHLLSVFCERHSCLYFKTTNDCNHLSFEHFFNLV